jgi:RNA polymerase sigma factor (sigma-70 family)
LSPDEILALLDDPARRGLLIEGLAPVVHAAVAHTLLPSATAARRDPRQDVLDLVHDVLLKLLANDSAVLRTWDPRRGKLETFVWTVARHHVLDVLKSKSRNPYTLEPLDFNIAEAASPWLAGWEEYIHARELLAELRKGLDERGQRLFDALFVEYRSTVDVAREMGMTPHAIYSFTARLARRLHEMVNEDRRQDPPVDPDDPKTATSHSGLPAGEEVDLDVDEHEYQATCGILRMLERASTGDWQAAAMRLRSSEAVAASRLKNGDDAVEVDRARILFRPLYKKELTLLSVRVRGKLFRIG